MNLCACRNHRLDLLILPMLVAICTIAVLPAEDQINPAQRGGGGDSTPSGGDHLPSYEMPAVVVPGRAKSELREEDPIGGYSQPRWTARRRFGETRVYVVPEGDFEFEYWLVPEAPRHHGRHEIKTQYEAEMGLPYRFQLDIYLVSHQDGNDGAMAFDEQKFEGRWAIANWGVIPGNPTFYLEWAAINAEPDHLEGKLLLADEFGTGWHWGVNFVLESQMGRHHELGHEVTLGLSKTIIDERFSVGAEAKFAWVNDNTDRSHYVAETLVGPSIQFRPMRNMHINLTGLLGTTKFSPESKAVIVIGWEFS
ncbi:MAG TPA: hypothetical protein VL860_05585 [Planctomycetota bacterium]|nr:hypothetical protein [Planctomycetota bacterium]